MQIRIDVFNAQGEALGYGPVFTATGAQVTRALDGAGSFSISAPAHDERALSLLHNEHRVRIYVDLAEQGLREVGRGIIRDVRYSAAASGWELSVSGPDMIDELKRRNVKFGRAYVDEPLRNIVADLVSLVPGWDVECFATESYTGRFDGVSVLKALQTLAEYTGMHLRLKLGGDTTANILQFGKFGTDIDLRLLNNGSRLPIENGEVALVNSFKRSTNTKNIVNRLYAIGAGVNVDAAIDLGGASRVTPEVQAEYVNDRVMYYIEDAASVARYGLIESVGQFKDIQSLGNTDTLQLLAKNALHDAAAAWLRRYSQPENRFDVTLPAVRRDVSVGDRVTVDYLDTVMIGGKLVTVEAARGDFYVMRCSESFSSAGATLSLEISDIDRHEESAAKLVVGALEQIRLQGMTVAQTFNHYLAGPEQVFVDAATAGTVQFTVTDKVTDVAQVLMRIRARPFTATAKGAEHRHVTFLLGGNIASGFPNNNRVVFGYKDEAGTLSVAAAINYTDPADPIGSALYTYGAAAGLDYGIHRDTTRPGDMTIAVNGFVVATGIGSTTSDTDITYDITTQILDKSGGFRGVHNIEITPASGQGELLVTFDVYEIITPARQI